MSQPDAVTTDDLTNMPNPDPCVDFADRSQLTYLVPSDSNLDFEKAFKDLEPGKAILDSIPQRESLFFDETVDILLVLQTPWTDEAALRSHLSRLLIAVDAHIVNGITANREAPTTESIFAGRVTDVNDPFIVVDEEDSDGEEDSGHNVYAVWKLPVTLTRPRMRLHKPTVVFSASASLIPDPSPEPSTQGPGYLQSGVPSGFNLLASFGDDPALNGVQPRLSALRVSRVAPVTRQNDRVEHIRALQHLELPIFPIIHTRIRFSRPNRAPSSPAVIALLEVDFTSYFECEVSLENIELKVADSVVESLNDDVGMNLPMSCVSHDHITFLYRIAPLELDVTPKNPTRDLETIISATALVVPGVCTPHIEMSWTTSLDFTTPVNPGFHPTTGPGMQRSHRPSQLSITGQAVHPLISPSVTRPDALPALEAATTQTEADLPDLGITMTFTGPSAPVHPGDVFSWTVYVVNRTPEKDSRPPRKLALVAVPKRRRNDVRMMRPPSTGTRRRGDKEIADAVLEENVLHAMQKSSIVDSTDVVCLSADTRIGPLAPGVCHVVELQFLALQAGIIGVEAIRVVDLGSQEHVDIRELPTMIVEPIAV